MAQSRIHDEGHDSSAKYFNQKWRDAFGKFVLTGFAVSHGSEPLTVTIGAGKALLDGVEIIESEDMPDALTLDPPHTTYDRFDTIALKYLFNETYPPNTASIVVIKGTPDPNPQKPALASDELELATIRMRAGQQDFSNSDISHPLRMTTRFAELIYRGITTQRQTPLDMNLVIWDTEEDPRTLGYTVKHGDFWLPPDENPPILRVYNGVLNIWVEKDHWDNIRGKPSEFTPEAHDFYGSRHYGRKPLPEDEHTLTNITHQQMMAIPLVFTF